METGDYVIVYGLVDKTEWNGLYAWIIQSPQLRALWTEPAGEMVEAEWAGVQILGPRCFGETGYLMTRNLKVVATNAHEQRAINIHLFGKENVPE